MDWRTPPPLIDLQEPKTLQYACESGIVTNMNLLELRAGWTEVLDRLERKNRIAWIAFFDARLESLTESMLMLDFSDSSKFATGHEYSSIRDSHRLALQSAIQEVFGVELTIVEKE